MIASYIALRLQILLLGTCQEISLHHVIYFYITVVLYRMLLLDLGDISVSIAWLDRRGVGKLGSPLHRAV